MHRLLQRQMRRAGMAPGTDPTPAQLEELLALGPFTLSAETVARVDAIVAPGRNVNPADAG